MRMKEAVWKGSRAETDPGARLRGKAVLEKGCGKTFRQEGEGWTFEGRDERTAGSAHSRGSSGPRRVTAPFLDSSLSGGVSRRETASDAHLPTRRAGQEGGGPVLEFCEPSLGSGLWGLDRQMEILW